MIELIVQVLDDVLRFSRGEFFFCHMTAAAQLLFQRIQRPYIVLATPILVTKSRTRPVSGSIEKRFPTTEKDRARARQRLIVVSKTSQKTGPASAVRILDRGEARRTREVGVPVCVVRSFEAFVLRSEALRSAVF